MTRERRTALNSPDERLARVLRALREAAGISREGWAAQLGYSRATVQRWEQGALVPDALAERALLARCAEHRLFRAYESGILTGIQLTPESLQAWLAAGRLGQRARVSVPTSAEPGAAALPNGLSRPALPLSLTSFIGREDELHEVAELLGTTRLLTITGPGGTGKTRLALAVAAAVASHFPDGVCFVDLVPIQEAGQVGDAIAEALGMRNSGSEALRAALVQRRMLLLVDNFEHVAGAAPLLHELLVAAPGLRALVTSRGPLHLSGEQEYPLRPLPVPDLATSLSLELLAPQPAIALFIARAQAVLPGFALTAANLRAVAEIVARLDGLPLAIELAAARSRLLPPAALLERLDPRLPLLTGGARNLPHRQQTLRDTIAWSVDLLSAQERVLFRRVAVFRGGFTLPAAEAICRTDADLDVFAGLTSLADQNLIGKSEVTDGGLRLALLATIHEFALGQLAASGEADAIARRHAEYFVTLAERAYRDRSSAGQRGWMPERANISTAFAWATEHGDSVLSLRFLGTQRWYEMATPVRERPWAERLLASPVAQERSAMRALALYFAGYMAWSQGDINAQLERLRESVELWREVGRPSQLALAPAFLALGLAVAGDCGAAQLPANEGVQAGRAAGDRWLETVALYNQGRVLATCGDDGAALDRYGEALAAAAATADEFITACIEVAAAAARYRLGDTVAATAQLERLWPVLRRYGDKRHLALLPANLGYIVAGRGESAEAAALFAESLRIGMQHDDAINTAGCIAGFGVCALPSGSPVRAARLFGAAEALLHAVGAVRWPGDRLTHQHWLAQVEYRLGASALRAALGAGQALSRDEAVALAMAPPSHDGPG